MKKNSWLFFLMLLVISCNDTNEADRLKREIVLKDKEIALQQKEIALQKKVDSIGNIKSRTLSDYYDEVKDAVFLIYTTDEINIAQGSAFVINTDGTAISNYHIFENASNAIAVNANDDKFIIDEIYDYSKEDDYIIFHLSRHYPYTFNPIKIADNSPRIGDECFAVGNPHGLTKTLSKGIVSGYRSDGQLIQTTAEITNGSSGGALFNEFGEVIGVTTSGMGEANLNFALNIKNIPYEKYLHTSISDSRLTDEDYTANVKKIISGYYTTYRNGDYAKLKSLFSSDIKRFHSLYNTTPDEAIASAYNYDAKRGITITQANIDWNRFQVSRVYDGYYVTFPLDYIISRTEKNKPSHFKINMTFELDFDYKITTIFENILARN